jgi:WXG100 family type VII secretion target
MAADIGAAKIRAEYDTLANIANQFAQESSAIEQLMSQITNLVGQLEGGGWIGRGAQTFYAEMHDEVEPGLQRLAQAFEDASSAIKQISNVFSQAEQDAGSLFGMR